MSTVIRPAFPTAIDDDDGGDMLNEADAIDSLGLLNFQAKNFWPAQAKFSRTGNQCTRDAIAHVRKLLDEIENPEWPAPDDEMPF